MMVVSFQSVSLTSLSRLLIRSFFFPKSACVRRGKREKGDCAFVCAFTTVGGKWKKRMLLGKIKIFSNHAQLCIKVHSSWSEEGERERERERERECVAMGSFVWLHCCCPLNEKINHLLSSCPAMI